MHEPDDSPHYTPMTLTPIDVDVDGLKDFRSFLVRELDTNLKPGAQGITTDHGGGAHFGIGNEGLQVQAARTRYAAALQASINNLTQYVAAAEIFIQAIQKVTTAYTEADLSAEAKSQAVSKTLFEALNKGVSDYNQAIQNEITHETERELNRGRSAAAS